MPIRARLKDAGFRRRSPVTLLPALAALALMLSPGNAVAHCFVGARFLPATLNTDDPCVADEMSLPTISWSRTADMPPAAEWDVGADFSKRITQASGISRS